VRESTYELRGLAFAALEWGTPGEGIPTVLLHGYLDHAGSWSRVAERLEGHVVAPDLRGHGHSARCGRGESYHFAEYVADLDALVLALGGRICLVGHSLGGTIASVWAGARPDRVERLVLVDGIGLHDSGARARERMVEFLDGSSRPERRRILPDLDAAVARLRAVHTTLPMDWARELAARGTRPVEGGLVWRYDPRHLLRSPTPYRHDQHLQFLRAMRCPVLSVHPERSPFAPTDVAALEGTIEDLSVATIPGAGHMVQLDAPDALADAVRAFLGRHGPEGCARSPG
jgi:pimeloyl-ACP methyl ester carboxylesterase